MWGRILQIVGLVLLAVIVAIVVSPWFDLHPTNLRTSKQSITHFSLVVPLFLPGALPVSATYLTKPRTLLSHQANDIVARDCARLC
jgi:hypothetical protein